MYTSPDQYVSQLNNSRKPLIMWLIATTVALLFVIGIVVAPIAIANGSTLIGLTTYQAFSNLCHQLPERSFFIAGQKFAVCARCTGLYAGFAAAALLYPLISPIARTDTPARKWLFVAAAPMALDVMLDFLGILANTHGSRFMTGAVLGAVVVFFVVPGLVELSVKGFGSFFRGSPKKTVSDGYAADVRNERIRTAPSDYSAPERRI